MYRRKCDSICRNVILPGIEIRHKRHVRKKPFKPVGGIGYLNSQLFYILKTILGIRLFPFLSQVILIEKVHKVVHELADSVFLKMFFSRFHRLYKGRPNALRLRAEKPA